VLVIFCNPPQWRALRASLVTMELRYQIGSNLC